MMVWLSEVVNLNWDGLVTRTRGMVRRLAARASWARVRAFSSARREARALAKSEGETTEKGCWTAAMLWVILVMDECKLYGRRALELYFSL